MKNKKDKLCEDCNKRIEANTLRTLDCKNDSCIGILKDAPDLIDNLCQDCKDDFEGVKKGLRKLKIDFQETKNLVRGLDYYTGTVFEITHPTLGAQDAIGAGGRYDNLVKDMGGPDTGAVGFALGLERIILALGEKALFKGKIVYIATLGDKARIEGLIYAYEIRNKLKPDQVLITQQKESSIKSQLREANKLGAKLVLIIGDDEIVKNAVTFKYMTEEKEDISVDRTKVVSEVCNFLERS